MWTVSPTSLNPHLPRQAVAARSRLAAARNWWPLSLSHNCLIMEIIKSSIETCSSSKATPMWARRWKPTFLSTVPMILPTSTSMISSDTETVLRTLWASMWMTEWRTLVWTALLSLAMKTSLLPCGMPPSMHPSMGFWVSDKDLQDSGWMSLRASPASPRDSSRPCGHSQQGKPLVPQSTASRLAATTWAWWPTALQTQDLEYSGSTLPPQLTGFWTLLLSRSTQPLSIFRMRTPRWTLT